MYARASLRDANGRGAQGVVCPTCSAAAALAAPKQVGNALVRVRCRTDCVNNSLHPPQVIHGYTLEEVRQQEQDIDSSLRANGLAPTSAPGRRGDPDARGREPSRAALAQMPREIEPSPRWSPPLTR
jgi:hypothetical protein